MGQVIIEFPDRMYGQLSIYCKNKEVTVEDFVFNCTADKLFVELHGDLNDKVPKITETIQETKKPKKINSKKVDRKDIENKNEEINKDETVELRTENEITEEIPAIEKKETVIKNKRTIKTK